MMAWIPRWFCGCEICRSRACFQGVLERLPEQEEVNKTASKTTTVPPMRQDGKHPGQGFQGIYHVRSSCAPKERCLALLANFKPRFPVVNEWACALMCAGHAKDGCCSYKDNAQRVGDENDGDNYEEDTGLCEFQEGHVSVDVSEADEWSSAECFAGYETSKCPAWKRGKCSGPSKMGAASMGLPIWELVWEDHFDHLTCVPDSSGIMRPNPHYWTAEVGYKRGKELHLGSPLLLFHTF